MGSQLASGYRRYAAGWRRLPAFQTPLQCDARSGPENPQVTRRAVKSDVARFPDGDGHVRGSVSAAEEQKSAVSIQGSESV